MKERNQYYDIVRGIAIIFMVFGHCIQYGNGTEFAQSGIFFEDKIFIFIYSFHMPLFMFLSGYLFFYSVQKYDNFISFIKNRVQRILLPIWGWQTFSYVVKIMSDEQKITECTKDDIIAMAVQYLNSLFRDIWFLWIIFWLSVIVYIIRKYFKDNIGVYFLLFLMTFGVPAFIYNSHFLGFMYPFFIGGYLCQKYKDNLVKIENTLKLKKIFLIWLAIYAILYAVWNKDAYIYTTGFALLGKESMKRQFCIDIYRMLIGFAGTFLIMIGLKLLYEKKPKNFIWGISSKVGQEAIGIYMLSGYLIHWILEANGDKFQFNYAMNILQTITLIVVCYLVTNLLKKIPIMDKIMLGGR